VRIFVDVGAHYGETLHVALNPSWGFGAIHVVEPVKVCCENLRKFKDRRIKVHPVALSDRDGSANIYGAGLLGGSLFSDKKQIALSIENISSEVVELQSATRWFDENIPLDAQVFLKLNCEGGEAAILMDLIKSGKIARVNEVYIDFDIRKVPSLSLMQEDIERQLRESNVSYQKCDPDREGGNRQVVTWLSDKCPKVRPSLLDMIWFRLGLYMPLYMQFTSLLAILLPQHLYWWFGRRYGRLARSRRNENQG
jgi:FkbM family methyltransferase